MGSLDRQREVTRSLFPWMRGVSTSAKALVITSATQIIQIMGKTIELAGGGPAVARVGDNCGRLIWDATAGILYYSPSPSAAYVAVASNPLTPAPPIPSTPGTNVVVATGSNKVTCG